MVLKKTKALVFTLSLAAASVFSTTVGAPEAEAATCYGDWCSGQDPQAAGCAGDAFTTVSADLGTGILEVRWSPSCQTNWARVTIYPTGLRCVKESYLDAIQEGGYTQSKVVPMTCNTYSSVNYWTPMIYSPVKRVKGRVQSYGTFTPVTETGWS
ncbi:MAG: DUF2690 domain-containing protein [Candidatus Saccharimonadales bacterium]